MPEQTVVQLPDLGILEVANAHVHRPGVMALHSSRQTASTVDTASVEHPVSCTSGGSAIVGEPGCVGARDATGAAGGRQSL